MRTLSSFRTPVSYIPMNPIVPRQAVAGVIPPQLAEGLIREAFPSVATFPAVASLGRILILSIVGAPLGWALMLPFYFGKVLWRYRLTNRRLMSCRGLRPVAIAEILLADIDDVRVVRDDNSKFFVAGNLEVISKGTVKLTLTGVPEPDAFRISILHACKAWVPEKSKEQGVFVPAKA